MSDHVLRADKGVNAQPYCDYADDELLAEVLETHIEIEQFESIVRGARARLKLLYHDRTHALREMALRGSVNGYKIPA